MKKLLLTFGFLLIASLGSFAKEHVIERGETLESIAAHYGVSTQALLNANPELKDMFFTGIVIQIPEGQTNSVVQTPQIVDPGRIPEANPEAISEAEPQISEDGKLDLTKQTQTSLASEPQVSSSKEDDELDFSCFTLSYMANFKAFGNGFYGVDWLMMKKYWGFMLSLKMNFGLTPKGIDGKKLPGDINFLFGGVVGLPLNKYIMPNLKVRGFITANSTDIGMSTTTTSHHTYKHPITKITVGGGMYFTPSVNVKIERFVIGMGYNLGFNCVKVGTGDLKFEYNQYTTNSQFEKLKTVTGFSHSLELWVGYAF